MPTKTSPFLALLLTLVLASCNKAIPTGFWTEYRKELLVKNISNQGPYGGHRAVYWKAAQPLTFDTKHILDFARKNGWTLSDSLVFNQDQTIKWQYMDKNIFPLSHTGFDSTGKNNGTHGYFPRWFGGQVVVYKFKTGWVSIDPGTDNAIEENGFVLLNQNKSEMAVYHLWGE